MCLIDWDIFFPFPQQRNSITAGGGLLDQIIRVLGLFLGSQSAGTMLILLPSSGTDSCWNLARHGLPFWDLEPSQQRAAAGDIFLWKLSLLSAHQLPLVLPTGGGSPSWNCPKPLVFSRIFMRFSSSLRGIFSYLPVGSFSSPRCFF